MVIQIGSLVTIYERNLNQFLNGRIGTVKYINSKKSLASVCLIDGMIVLINTNHLVLLHVDFERMTITAK